MVCHVKSSEAGFDVGMHGSGSGGQVETLAIAFHIGYLPKAGENSRYP